MSGKKKIGIVFAILGIAALAFGLTPYAKTLTEYAWVLSTVGGALMFIGLLLILYRGKEGVKLSAKYERKGTLISRAEYDFLLVLRQISPERYEVVPQVALVSVIDKKTENSYRNELFRICDYCFVDRDTFEPLLLVELNDSSHKRADRVQRDEKVNAICKAAKMPLITFWMDDDLSYKTVKHAVQKSILR